MTWKKFSTLSWHRGTDAVGSYDTDMIIKDVLKTIKRSSLGGNLLDEMRFDRQGNEIADFVLNKPAYREALCWSQATISGCGSREHAPWAIADFGIAA
jgi:3-isopropylmalate/(R)-2-methylmalate dehydratase small subunit